MNASDEADVVVACSLTAGEAADRTAEFRALFAESNVAYVLEPRVLRLWLNDAPGREGAVRTLLDLDREYCPFLTHDVVGGTPRFRVKLTVPSEAAEQWLGLG
jgi:hypothetical protein